MSVQESNVDIAEVAAVADPASSEFSIAETEIDMDESHLVRGYN
ncbi:hypothetical protein [Saccharopolyspora sp. 5N708]